jgi:hypothetical protein
VNLQTTVQISDVINEMRSHKILGRTFCARLPIPEQIENQNIKIEENAWMQELRKKKIKATNIIQKQTQQNQYIIALLTNLFHESRIFFWTSC